MPRNVDAEVLHDGHCKRIEILGAHAAGGDIDLVAVELAHQSLGHRGANGIVATGKENGTGKVSGHLALRLTSPMKDAYQGKQPSSGIEIDLHLAVQALDQDLAAFIVQTAPRHVDRLDLARGRCANSLIVAFANHEIVLDDATKWRQRQSDDDARSSTGIGDVEQQPTL